MHTTTRSSIKLNPPKLAPFLEVTPSAFGTNAAQNAPAVSASTQLYFPPHSLYCRSYSPLPTRFQNGESRIFGVGD